VFVFSCIFLRCISFYFIGIGSVHLLHPAKLTVHCYEVCRFHISQPETLLQAKRALKITSGLGKGLSCWGDEWPATQPFSTRSFGVPFLFLLYFISDNRKLYLSDHAFSRLRALDDPFPKILNKINGHLDAHSRIYPKRVLLFTRNSLVINPRFRRI
jgi:hypothetical protein